MQKKEIVWREILFQSLEQGDFEFQQQKLTKKFGFSLSTIFNALKLPREIGAIKVTGKGFRLINAEKMLYLWGTHRKFKKDIIYHTFVSLPVEKIEANMPPGIIWGSFSAYKSMFKSVPSDYGQVYVYVKDLASLMKRFPSKKGPENLFVLKQDDNLESYGHSGTLGQIFVDIWNSDEWYAGEFIKRIKEKIK